MIKSELSLVDVDRKELFQLLINFQLKKNIGNINLCKANPAVEFWEKILQHWKWIVVCIQRIIQTRQVISTYPDFFICCFNNYNKSCLHGAIYKFYYTFLLKMLQFFFNYRPAQSTGHFCLKIDLESGFNFRLALIFVQHPSPSWKTSLNLF